MEQLTTRDCAVGLVKIGDEKILLVSAYLDIKEKVIQDWANKVMEFANRKRYPIIWGMDSNSHSTLFGKETNARGEDLEEFLINNAFFIENIGLMPTFETIRQNGPTESIIDVTISRGCLLYTSPSPRD